MWMFGQTNVPHTVVHGADIIKIPGVRLQTYAGML